MPSENAIDAPQSFDDANGAATVHPDAPARPGGGSVRKKRKHKGGFNNKSRKDHPGVSVVKRGKSFWIKWRIDFRPGVYRYQWLRLHGVADKAAAHREAKRKSEELAAGKRQARHHRPGTKHLLPLSAAVDAYLAHVANERRDRDAAFVRRAVNGAKGYLAPFVAHVVKAGIRRCEQLTVDDLTDYRDGMGGSGMENTSINRLLDAARAMLNFASDARYTSLEPRAIGKALKHYPVRLTKPRVLTRSELRRLIAAVVKHDSVRWQSSRRDTGAYHAKRQSETARPRYRPLAPFVVMALLTGARPGEIERIAAGDVHMEHRYILLREEKNNRERTVPLHDSPLLAELAAALKLRASGAPVVGRVKLAHITALGDAAGIKGLTRKTLRSTCVAHVASGSTESEYLLAARFGHGAEVSIRHYRQALHGVKDRGATIEAWLGIEAELRVALETLGYIAPRKGGAVRARGA